MGLSIGLFAALGCEQKTDDAEKAAASARAAASTPAPEKPTEPPPRGCQATGDEPVELATVLGDVYGFGSDATHLYYTSWQTYGGRGDLGMIRKDGGGSRTLASLRLEPRGLALTDDTVFFTSGIRLAAIPKGGGETKIPAPRFSAQDIAIYRNDVFGVPGDYGPYDRVAKIPIKGGETKELASGKRPSRNVGPNGYSSVVVDDSGAYVTDSGNNRVLRFALDGGKPKTVTARKDKPYDLALVGDDLYFNLARKGELWTVPKMGGATKKLSSGLVTKARLVADDRAVFTTLAPEGEDGPRKVAKVESEGGEHEELATVPSTESVDAMALDGDCLYWVQRINAKKSLVYARPR